MPRSLIVVTLSALVAGSVPTGCSGQSDPPAGTPASSVTASAPTDEPPGAIACATVIRAVRDGSLMTSGVVADVVNASATADAPVADEAQRLSAAYAAAVAAQGTDDEPDAVAAVSAAGAAMVQVCADSGLETVG